MRNLIQALLFFSCFLFGCTVLKPNTPLEKVDFKEHSWKLVYIEDEDPDTGKFVQNIWILDDSKIIDSLRNEYRYDLNKQGDGNKEYQVFLFKDNRNYDWVCFNNKKYFQLGKLKFYLVPVNTSYYYFPNSHTATTFADSLEKLNLIYTISPLAKEYEKLDEYVLKINLHMNSESRLLKGKNPGYYDCLAYAKEELTKLYPGPDSTTYSFCEYESDYFSRAPGDLSQRGIENFEYLRNEQKIVVSSTTFDISRLKTTDLFSGYEVCTLYTITVYTKK